MTSMRKIATVFGGTGFVGRQVVRELARKGYTVKVASRVPESAFFLRPAGVVGQIVPFACDYKNPVSLGEAVKGCDVVVNCIGILFERRKGDFQRLQAELPGQIAAACAYEGVKKFVHVSSLSAANGTSQYAKTKLQGEENVLANFPTATILRPSIIFGADDQFFNRFARMAQVLPAMLLIAKGKTRFQPVYVGDVADAVMAAIDHPHTAGQIFELGGPEILNFKEIYERMYRYTHQPRKFVNVSFGMAKMQACILSLAPNPILTKDQVETLKTDNVVNANALGLGDLGISPTGLDAVLPTYLESYRPGGKFASQRAA